MAEQLIDVSTSSITIAYEQEKALANYAKDMYKYEVRYSQRVEEALDKSEALRAAQQENICEGCVDWKWLPIVGAAFFLAGIVFSIVPK